MTFCAINFKAKSNTTGVETVISNELFKVIPIENIDESQVAFNYVADGMFSIDISDNNVIANKAECIIIGKVCSIDGVVNYNPSTEHYVMARTIGNVEVLQVLKGNLTNNEIPFIRLGGTLPLSEFEKSLFNAQVTKMGLDKMSQEEKENLYVIEKNNKDIDIEKDKIYLMYMTYSDDYKRYEIEFMEYGLREVLTDNDNSLTDTFNSNLNKSIKVKNNQTGDYETLDSVIPKTVMK